MKKILCAIFLICACLTSKASVESNQQSLSDCLTIMDLYYMKRTPNGINCDFESLFSIPPLNKIPPETLDRFRESDCCRWIGNTALYELAIIYYYCNVEKIPYGHAWFTYKFALGENSALSAQDKHRQREYRLYIYWGLSQKYINDSHCSTMAYIFRKKLIVWMLLPFYILSFFLICRIIKKKRSVLPYSYIIFCVTANGILLLIMTIEIVSRMRDIEIGYWGDDCSIAVAFYVMAVFTLMGMPFAMCFEPGWWSSFFLREISEEQLKISQLKQAGKQCS